jgi:hypothetical protein
MSNKKFETTPNSLYFLAGSLSAVVFLYNKYYFYYECNRFC